MTRGITISVVNIYVYMCMYVSYPKQHIAIKSVCPSKAELTTTKSNDISECGHV